MASLVGDHARGTLRARWRELLERTPGRAEFALRLAIICALTAWIGLSYRTLDVALSTYVVFFMNKPDRTSSMLTSVAFTILVGILIGLLILIAGVAVDIPPLRVAIMAAISMALLFLASASKLKPLASTIALILVYALDLLGKIPEGELITRALLYVWLLVAIPAGVSVLVNLLMGPSPTHLAERAIALRLRAARALLVTPDAVSRHSVASLRAQGDADIRKHLHLAALEKTSALADVASLQQATGSTSVLLLLVEQIDRVGNATVAWRQEAATRLADMAAILDRHLYPVDIAPIAPDGVPPSSAAASLTSDFNAVLISFAITPKEPVNETAGEKTGFFVADAFHNPEHIQYATKVTMAAMLCYLFYSLTDWQGIHTCLITCYIVGLDTTGETVEKLLLRLTGALTGASIGIAAIVWLTPAIDNVSGLLALVFAGALAGGWIAAGSPRIAYAGFQLTFAILLCVIQGSSPAFDLSIARDRIIGILLGIGVVYVIFVSVWPVSIARGIDPALSSLFRQLAGIGRLKAVMARLYALPNIRPVAAKIDTDLQIAYYEPSSLQPPADWLKRRQALLKRLPSLEYPLLYNDGDQDLDSAADRFDRMADAIDRGDAESLFAQANVEGHPGWEQNLAH
ncbi:FUSC family protein [Dyella sp. C11]|uniref:FUSC family protein n=1 Tax=Dyella sp. C11 TaxID=2126991 RepID=UPI000D653F20|nr:FUSC family protein [Dyella sp. C11]